jgi:hypothetical protein
MIKSWYGHVREETMAPARMVSFIEQHAETCEICLQDPELKEEIAKITEMILPESKIPKAVRQQNSKIAAAEAVEEAKDDNDEENETGDEEDEEDKELDVDVDVEIVTKID